MTADLNILCLSKSGKNLVGSAHNQYLFEKELGKVANVAYAGEGFPNYAPNETLDETVGRVMPDADWVIDGDNQFHIKIPKDRSYNVGVFISDLHAKHGYSIDNPVGLGSLLSESDYDMFFMRYPLIYGTRYRSDIVLSAIKNRSFWVPWSIDIDQFYPREEQKYDVTMLGTLNRCYPLRQDIWDGIYYTARGFRVLRKEPPTLPNYVGTYQILKNKYIVGKDYCEALGSTRILIFDCSDYLYPILKFFEASASGCLMLSNAPSMGKRLGFEAGKTFVEINKENWEEVLRLHLAYPEFGDKIAEAGMKVTREYHNHQIRAQQLVSFMQNWEGPIVHEEGPVVQEESTGQEEGVVA